jgi:MFS family permease
MRAGAYLRSLDPKLPRSVQILQAGGLANAFGNGIVYPFLFIYLHNVRGIGLGTVGLVLAASGAVSLVTGPAAGPVIDRIGSRWTIVASLVFLAVGYGGYAAVRSVPEAFATSVVAGVGNGAFWPSQSTLIARLTPREKRPVAFAMQRVVGNLGFGLGGVTGGLIASTSSVWSFRALFLVDGATFVAYLLVVLARVPEPSETRERVARVGAYLDVLRHRVFMALIAINCALITAGFATLELLPVFMKNHAGVGERGVGLVFFANTIVIVVAQLPIARLAEGRRRMPLFLLLAAIWAAALALTPVIAAVSSGTVATALFAVSISVFALGECVHGAVQAPLVVDLARPALIGRYMALSAFSWQVGFTIGPAAGGFLLAALPNGVWGLAAGACLVAGLASLALEPAIPRDARRSPVRDEAQALGVGGAPT